MDWTKIRNFTKNENWGEADRMNENLIMFLDQFRDHVQTPIQINCGTQGEHLADSQHQFGRAVDIMFPKKTLQDIPNLFLEALRFPFMGVGLYNGWKLNGVVMGGLHLDVRPSLTKNLWLGRVVNGKTAYETPDWGAINAAFGSLKADSKK